MLSVSNLLCEENSGQENLRYGHARESQNGDGTPRPVVVWAITKACNLRCVHCYACATPDAPLDELTREQGFALLDDLAKFKVPAVLFSGGEPLVRADCLDFIAYARNIGLRCTLSTNGVLIDDACAEKLAETGLQYVGISLDGTEVRHDILRGAKGSFRRSMSAIDRCKRLGMKVGVRFTVHALNTDELDCIFDLCDLHHVDRLCIYHLAYAGRGNGMQKVDLTAIQTRGLMDRIFDRVRNNHLAGRKLEVLTVGNHADGAYLLMELQKTDPFRAEAARERLLGTGGNRSGCNIASIDSIGNVHYDQFSWHYTCGNVRKSPFSENWKNASDPRLAILRDRRAHLPERCRQCRFLDTCNGNLRTRAEMATANWMGQDPGCYLQDSEIRGQSPA
jgi:Fe-coproporphyrin III synthase